MWMFVKYYVTQEDFNYKHINYILRMNVASWARVFKTGCAHGDNKRMHSGMKNHRTYEARRCRRRRRDGDEKTNFRLKFAGSFRTSILVTASH